MASGGKLNITGATGYIPPPVHGLTMRRKFTKKVLRQCKLHQRQPNSTAVKVKGKVNGVCIAVCNKSPVTAAVLL